MKTNSLTESDVRARGVSHLSQDPLAATCADGGELARARAELEHTTAVGRASKVADYVFCAAYGLIGLQIVLELLGAEDPVGFTRLVDTVTMPLLAPFQRLMFELDQGRFHTLGASLMALAGYMMLHLALHGLLRLSARARRS